MSKAKKKQKIDFSEPEVFKADQRKQYIREVSAASARYADKYRDAISREVSKAMLDTMNLQRGAEMTRISAKYKAKDKPDYVGVDVNMKRYKASKRRKK